MWAGRVGGRLGRGGNRKGGSGDKEWVRKRRYRGRRGRGGSREKGGRKEERGRRKHMDLFKNTAIKETESGPFRRQRRYIIRRK